jgi:hypothetical protein
MIKYYGQSLQPASSVWRKEGTFLGAAPQYPKQTKPRTAITALSNATSALIPIQPIKATAGTTPKGLAQQKGKTQTAKPPCHAPRSPSGWRWPARVAERRSGLT